MREGLVEKRKLDLYHSVGRELDMVVWVVGND